MKTPLKKQRLIAIIAPILVLISMFFVVRWAVQNYRAAQNLQTASKISIVASTNVWGDIARQVGGDHVQVTSVLSDPTTDPHLFEADAQTASKVASARLVITNGLGYDEFMNKLLDAAPNSDRTVLTASIIIGSKSDANPHIWYELSSITKIAKALADQLAIIDPAHAVDYHSNAQAFAASMAPVLNLQKTIAKQRAGQGAAYTERLPQYLLNDLGMIDRTPADFAAAVESGTEPTPQQVQRFIGALQSGSIKVLFYNSQTVNDVTKQIMDAAKANNVLVVPVTETIPAGQTFQQWQMSQLRAIL